MVSRDVDILFSKEEVENKVAELAKKINEDYKSENLLVVGILKGAFVFMADIIRKMDIAVEVDFMDVSSYGASSVSSGVVRIEKDLDSSIEGKNVLIIEDIVDTGLTLEYIVEVLKRRGPKSVKVCCLLDKPARRKSNIDPDYIGFSIPDEFIVGYGLDYAEKYRNLPDVCILKPSVYKE
ncbi:Hypoxanthine-guanine phosphoribosyltransferase [Candidatus Syntrophocurvum alkaliphilum]|uniref:Hypoxanthine phosphoribosyltransferase n=1 Tax=Candidatus Syntrophocurvum alkaliphilum TaxID=2293317 RepID=A0A6I6DBF9_9FIRM|nr:hypoxanthine phosphoribosyltransferase [Candidatus Syntrophocurvum alkaliphilum]QGT98765.1 Hypoxanthine-guanine phosphoribosyltransferase [Candidatus Syntrophocurvum alkaliphilum]